MRTEEIRQQMTEYQRIAEAVELEVKRLLDGQPSGPITPAFRDELLARVEEIVDELPQRLAAAIPEDDQLWREAAFDAGKKLAVRILEFHRAQCEGAANQN